MWDWIPEDEARQMADVWAIEDGRHERERRIAKAHRALQKLGALPAVPPHPRFPRWNEEVQAERRAAELYLHRLDDLDLKLEHEAPLTPEERALYDEIFGAQTRR